MEFLGVLFMFAVLAAIVLLPAALIIADIKFLVKKEEAPIFEFVAFIIGSVYIFLGLAFWDLPGYEEPLNTWGGASVHEPFSTSHMIAIVLFGGWGFLSYYKLKFMRREYPPIVEVFLLAGVYVGIALSVVWMVQLLGGVSNGVRLDGTDYFVIACLCIVPVIYIIHCICLMVELIKEKAKRQEEMVYDNELLSKFNRFLYKGANLFWLAVVALLPVLTILTVILVLFGQQPDSIILAFTKTSDWVLSGEIAPPPVTYDAHYLCTVSLRGHEKLVKPTRYGIRKGEKIVVNRQLCVANAFEQLIQERTPRFHRAIRNFYDTYGYPISKHINSAWSADVVYLLMKPLEWIFLFVLYLFDKRPEDRINSQYLPKVSK